VPQPEVVSELTINNFSPSYWATSKYMINNFLAPYSFTVQGTAAGYAETFQLGIGEFVLLPVITRGSSWNLAMSIDPSVVIAPASIGKIIHPQSTIVYIQFRLEDENLLFIEY
jgi:hypothetical protein